jgi:hypothetical protein
VVKWKLIILPDGKMVLQTDVNLTPEEAKAIQDAWTGDPVILGGQIDEIVDLRKP